jgi:hypothetical protein
MHDPIRFLAMRGTTFIENKSFSHSNPFSIAIYNFVTACGFPEACSRGAIGSRPGWILLVLVAEEVPIILWSCSYFAFLYQKTNIKNSK